MADDDRDASLFIRRVGQRLLLPPRVIGTAATLYGRVLRASDVAPDDPLHVGTACVFLAGKVEETPRHIRDVINVAHAVRAPRAPPMALDDAYWHAKARLVNTEQAVLRAVGFDVEALHPHRYVLDFAQALGIDLPATQAAWALCTDSSVIAPDELGTPPAPPHAIAAAAILLGAALAREHERSVAGACATPAGGLQLRAGEPAWWELFGCETRDVERASLALLQLLRPARPQGDATA